MDLLDRFLANMEVGVGAFTSCDIRQGYQLTFEPCTTASLHYCLSGQGTLRLRNGPAIPLCSNCFVLLPPGMIYTMGAGTQAEEENGGIRPLRRLRAPFFSESVPTLRAGDGESGVLTACGEIQIASSSTPNLFAGLNLPLMEQFDWDTGLRSQFVILLAESVRPGIGTRALTEALLKQCLILLLRRAMDHDALPLPWLAAFTDPGLARSLQAIFDHPSERFTVESLAAIAGMSRSAFAAHFSQTLGHAPMELLRLARLRRAKEQLATTNLPVAQIAGNVGFSSRSNFSHAFRTAYGVDPTGFRAVLFQSPETE